MRNKYLIILLLFCIHSYSQNTNNINEAPPSAFKYQGVPEVNLHKTDAEIPTLKRDDLKSSAKKSNEVKALTKDHFSNLGSKPQKKRFETYTPNKKKSKTTKPALK